MGIAEQSNDPYMRDYIELRISSVREMMDERFGWYIRQMETMEKALYAAILAQKESVDAAFRASDKAIIKAENAQKEYNDRSNEFRAQLGDQAATLMPRLEAVSLFKGVEDKGAFRQQNYEAKFETMRVANEKSFDALSKEIADLRESRSMEQGGRIQSLDTRAILAMILMVALSLAGMTITLILSH